MISVNDPTTQTWIFGIFFVAVLLLSTRFVNEKKIFPYSVTQELKGFAIFAIIFAHIGYILSTSEHFLWPFSIMAGVGVNLYLFLSGYGLSMSELKKSLSPIKFYKKRLANLFLPFWIILFSFIALDYFLLSQTYHWADIAKASVGIFQTADINKALNSPLWFFTLIVVYYLVFPLIFMKKRLWLSALILIIAGYLIVHANLSMTSDVIRLYKVHFLAFPLGMILAWIVSSKNVVSKKIDYYFSKLKIFFANHTTIKLIFYFASIAVLIFLISYGGYHSFAGLGTYKEQLVSILVMFGIVLLFVLKKVQIKLLYIFGLYSYEIYLLHWPILSRYDFLYPRLPAWLATLLYLALFLILGYLLSLVTKTILKKLHNNSEAI